MIPPLVILFVFCLSLAAQPNPSARPGPPRFPMKEREAREFQQLWSDHLSETVATTNSLDMVMVLIPPGSFEMGSPASEVGRRNDEDQVSVTLAESFRLSQTEVTQGQWRRVMGSGPHAVLRGSPLLVEENSRHPMWGIKYSDAIRFCNRLTNEERKAGQLSAEYEYRLPTEAEWEYAARAGTTTPTAFGDDLTYFQANIDCRGLQCGPTDAGMYPPNAWGLCDMHGNVWELVEDKYQGTVPGGVDPVVAAPSGADVDRVVRGGSYRSGPLMCRSAVRNKWPSNMGNIGHGFRVALVRLDSPPNELAALPPFTPSPKLKPASDALSAAMELIDEKKVRNEWCLAELVRLHTELGDLSGALRAWERVLEARKIGFTSGYELRVTIAQELSRMSLPKEDILQHVDDPDLRNRAEFVAACLAARVDLAAFDEKAAEAELKRAEKSLEEHPELLPQLLRYFYCEIAEMKLSIGDTAGARTSAKLAEYTRDFETVLHADKLARLYVDLNDRTAAMRVARRPGNRDTSRITLRVEALCGVALSTQQIHALEEAYDELEEIQFPPDRQWALLNLASAFIQLNRNERASALLDEAGPMIKGNHRASSRLGRWFQLASRAKPQKHVISELSDLLNQAVAERDKLNEQKFLDNRYDRMRALEGRFTALALGFVACGQIERAISILDVLSDPEDKTAIWLTLAASYIRGESAFE